jgi:hypothetical protein
MAAYGEIPMAAVIECSATARSHFCTPHVRYPYEGEAMTVVNPDEAAGQGGGGGGDSGGGLRGAVAVVVAIIALIALL